MYTRYCCSPQFESRGTVVNPIPSIKLKPIRHPQSLPILTPPHLAYRYRAQICLSGQVCIHMPRVTSEFPSTSRRDANNYLGGLPKDLTLHPACVSTVRAA